LGSGVLSIVVPLYKSVDHVEGLLKSFHESGLQIDEIELVFVIDGCTQIYSFENYLELCKSFYAVRVFKLQQNHGQHAASFFACLKAEGEALVTLDADSYQYDKLYSLFIRSAEQLNADIIYADLRYKKRKLYRRLGSAIFKVVMFFQTRGKVFRNGSSLRLIRKSYFEHIQEKLQHNTDKFDLILLRNTRRIAFIPFVVSDSNRDSSYTFSKLIKLFFASFQDKPNIPSISGELIWEKAPRLE